jgi:2-dehydro-3-deoxygluconokinase
MERIRVITLGEIMLRLAPPGYYRFLQTQSYGAVYGGGEANVAVSLANFGLDSAYVTKLPTHEIGQGAVNALRGLGVDTSLIVRGGSRIGIYYMEKGAAQRPSKVIYDRAHSAIAEAAPGDFDWERIMAGASWFHFTGITPALSDSAAALCTAACGAAKAAGVPISCDLNYRKNLWSRDKAGKVMGDLMQYLDLLFANEEDAEAVFGIKAPDSDLLAGKISAEGYKAVAAALAERFGIGKVAITLRESISASDNNWAALYRDGEAYHFSRKYPVHIVDRVGGGDAFAAGLIYSLLRGRESAGAVEFAAAAGALKHSIEGDYNMVSSEEVEKLLAGDGSGRVQR